MLLTVLAGLLFSTTLKSQEVAKEKVVLVHGYACPRFVMNTLANRLRKGGFDVDNYPYPAIKVNLDKLGYDLYYHVRHSGLDSVSFVTHSMGGLVLRSMLQYAYKDASFPKITRIVMLAPPSNGAEMANWFSGRGWRWLMGPNLYRMRTVENSYARQLPLPENTEVGVIAGIAKSKRGFNPFIKGNNDGVLSPQAARLGNEDSFLIIKCEHTTFLFKKRVSQLTLEFLKSARFESLVPADVLETKASQ